MNRANGKERSRSRGGFAPLEEQGLRRGNDIAHKQGRRLEANMGSVEERAVVLPLALMDVEEGGADERGTLSLVMRRATVRKQCN